MVDRDTLRMVLDQYLAGEITQSQLSGWAYDIIRENGETGDRVVTEVLYNLVSIHYAGNALDQCRASRERLQFFLNWLENKNEFNWEYYSTVFDPVRIM